MAVRIVLPGAIKPLGGKMAKAIFAWIERGMLAGDDEAGGQPALLECVRDGRQLDCFGPGADDQPDIETQPSP
jgi:hypothetical protein